MSFVIFGVLYPVIASPFLDYISSFLAFNSLVSWFSEGYMFRQIISNEYQDSLFCQLRCRITSEQGFGCDDSFSNLSTPHSLFLVPTSLRQFTAFRWPQIQRVQCMYTEYCFPRHSLFLPVIFRSAECNTPSAYSTSFHIHNSNLRRGRPDRFLIIGFFI